MEKLTSAIASLQKLYAQKTALNKQITAFEKKLIAESKALIKAQSKEKKPPTRKPGAKKAVARKPKTAPKT